MRVPVSRLIDVVIIERITAIAVIRTCLAGYHNAILNIMQIFSQNVLYLSDDLSEEDDNRLIVQTLFISNW